MLLGGGDEDAPPGRAATPTPAPSASPEATASPTAEPTPERRPQGSLAIGITEPSPHFVSTGATHAPFERWRLEMEKLRPTFYRLVVDWPVVQPTRRRPRMDAPTAGCMREVPPCAAWSGLREQLAALASRQREGPGEWEALVVVTGTPEWAAAPESDCERASTLARSRPLSELGYGAYRRLIRAVGREAGAQGARLAYWSPWNEPNHPYFLSTQRCGPEPAAQPYARLVGAMQAALKPGQELVLGELAGLHEVSGESTTIREFVDALPREVICASRIWGQHAYIGGRDPVDEASAALRRHGCERKHEIWITETGTREGTCRQMHERLLRWYRDPRVAAAFQYTLREDNRFPTGLVTTALDRAKPALAMWQAWGARDRPHESPPRNRCGG